MAKIRLPYGIDDFEKVRTENCYYIDKTGFIKELLEETFEVNLITRPRRFGKTLNMRMLSEFFDIRKDSRALFEGLEISKDKELCETWMNKWPVLFLTLKDVEGEKFEDAYGLLTQTIAKLYMEHSYLLQSNKTALEYRETASKLMRLEESLTDIQSALDILLCMMRDHYGKRVILLIDEYDVPLVEASENGYYREMANVIRSFYGMVWKSNPALKFAVVTGCLRLAKESIFAEPGNLIFNSVSDKNYQNYFGFTEGEVSRLLADAKRRETISEMKKWCGSYRFEENEIYCPWDVLKYARDAFASDREAISIGTKEETKVPAFRAGTDREALCAGAEGKMAMSVSHTGADGEGIRTGAAKEAEASGSGTPSDSEAVAYVDGSFRRDTQEYAYGVVLFHDGQEEHFNEKFSDAEMAQMHNVAGEIEGAKKAMQICFDRGIKKLTLFYDYEGIEKWCTRAWQAKKPGTVAYRDFYDRVSERIEVHFVKVKAHTGVACNELADSLARNALGIEMT